MKHKETLALDSILQALFAPYKKNVPDVDKVSKAMIDNGIIQNETEIVNDHIAFRTLGVPHLGIASFEKIFLHHGYVKKEYYYFEGKKLDAYWYAPPSDHYPRIFLSELRVSELSEEAQEIILSLTKHITKDPIDAIDLNDAQAVGDFFYRPLWELPTLAAYKELLKESEYAAWVMYNRYYLNHYTISVHDLSDDYNTVAKFNTFLESIGIALNTSGGKIKTSKDGLLKQSSTVAKTLTAGFANEEYMEIAGSYVEFAERLVLPEYKILGQEDVARKHRRDGFESANADKIFESTYTEQINGTKS